MATKFDGHAASQLETSFEGCPTTKKLASMVPLQSADVVWSWVSCVNCTGVARSRSAEMRSQVIRGPVARPPTLTRKVGQTANVGVGASNNSDEFRIEGQH